MTTSNKYGRPFYQGIGPGSEASARRMLPLVVELVRPASAVDVGCGDGSWLSVLRELGVAEVAGIDGPWALGDLKIDRSEFVPVDLSAPLHLARRFDLAMSLEVAEHLPASVAPQFVEQLTELAPVVLFSAAVPGQGGTGHINEQWPEYWAGLFGEYGYAMVDVLRRRFWDDPSVEPWYAQNVFFFANAEALAASTPLAAAAAQGPQLPLRVIHPDMLVRREHGLSLGHHLRDMPRAFGTSLRHRTARLLSR